MQNLPPVHVYLYILVCEVNISVRAAVSTIEFHRRASCIPAKGRRIRIMKLAYIRWKTPLASERIPFKTMKYSGNAVGNEIYKGEGGGYFTKMKKHSAVRIFIKYVYASFLYYFYTFLYASFSFFFVFFYFNPERKRKLIAYLIRRVPAFGHYVYSRRRVRRSRLRGKTTASRCRVSDARTRSAGRPSVNDGPRHSSRLKASFRCQELRQRPNGVHRRAITSVRPRALPDRPTKSLSLDFIILQTCHSHRFSRDVEQTNTPSLSPSPARRRAN